MRSRSATIAVPNLDFCSQTIGFSPWMSSAVKQARNAWSSSATGAPNTAIKPSPVNLIDRCRQTAVLTTSDGVAEEITHDLA